MTAFATNLQQLMESKGLTQRDLAKGVNLSQVTVHRFINGKAKPRSSNLIAIANYFNIPKSKLVNGSINDVLDKSSNAFTRPEQKTSVIIENEDIEWWKPTLADEIVILKSKIKEILATKGLSKARMVIDIELVREDIVINGLSVLNENFDLCKGNTFAANLKNLIEANNLSLRGFARNVNLSHVSVHKMLKGKTKPKSSTVISIAKYFQIPEHELVYGNIDIDFWLRNPR